MAKVRLEHVWKRFGKVVAVKDFNLETEDGEFVVFVGPSGCGKTTTLRMIAGLELPTEGQIFLGGEDVTFKRASARDIAFVFQMFALYPHMSVRQNIAFPLVSQGMPRAEIDARVAQAAATLQITHLLKSSVSGLTSGDRQRVALGRAIVRQPLAFMMDEPLGALDAEFRELMCLELRALHDRLGATTVYVTHDQEEALVMSDRIAVMRSGRIEQVGLPDEVYERPKTRFVAAFLGRSNFLPARPHPLGAETPLGPLRLKAPLAREALLAIRPEKIRLYPAQGGVPARENLVRAVVEEIVYTGAENQYYLRAGEVRLLAYTLNQDLQEPGAEEFGYGEEVLCYLPPENLVVVHE